MVMRTRLLLCPVLLVWICCFVVTGCNGSDTSSLQGDEAVMLISYSLILPSDLPPGLRCEDKMGITQNISVDDIEQQYSSIHRRGWDDCLNELDREWVPDRKPVFLMQGYGWEGRGYTDGYRACQAEVRRVVQKVGLEQAKQAVHNTVCAHGGP